MISLAVERTVLLFFRMSASTHFALGFIPAKFHRISYPQLYPQSNPVIKGGGGLTASAAWNLDFWGLYRLSRLSRRAVERAVERQTEAARAELLASQWAQRATRVTLVQDVAQAYFQLRSPNPKI